MAAQRESTVRSTNMESLTASHPTVMASFPWQQLTNACHISLRSLFRLDAILTVCYTQLSQASWHQAAELNAWQLYRLLCWLFTLETLAFPAAAVNASMGSIGNQESMLLSPFAGTADADLATRQQQQRPSSCKQQQQQQGSSG
jgi:hypothetical protein